MAMRFVAKLEGWLCCLGLTSQSALQPDVIRIELGFEGKAAQVSTAAVEKIDGFGVWYSPVITVKDCRGELARNVSNSVLERNCRTPRTFSEGAARTISSVASSAVDGARSDKRLGSSVRL